MSAFPEWVPSSLVDFYKRLEAKEPIEGIGGEGECDPAIEEFVGPWYPDSDDFKQGLQLLQRLMESKEMEKAWKAIAKRSIADSLEELAKIILILPNQLMTVDWRTHEDVMNRRSSLSRLSNDINFALHAYRRSLNDVEAGLIWVEGLYKEVKNLEELIRDHENIEAGFAQWIGKPGAKNAKRTWLVCFLSDQFDALFGQPLYASIASIVGVVLKETPLETDHVRQLVKNHRLRASRCAD
jgi:hypothetical protein